MIPIIDPGVVAAQAESVPAAAEIEYHLWGAGGGGATWSNPNDVLDGGSGAYITGTIYVTPGTTVYWLCGSPGNLPTVGTYGYAGAGRTTGSGTTGAGGGLSGLFESSINRANALAIAPGGSGGGWVYGGRGGNRGPQNSGTMQGDNAYTPGDNRATGGAGGGYNGGDASSLTNPGGGSVFHHIDAINTATEAGKDGVTSGSGSTGGAAVGTLDPYYTTNAGKGGGYGSAGTAGRVVIYVNNVEQVSTSTPGTGFFTV